MPVADGQGAHNGTRRQIRVAKYRAQLDWPEGRGHYHALAVGLVAAAGADIREVGGPAV